jgi:hypothetical protein
VFSVVEILEYAEHVELPGLKDDGVKVNYGKFGDLLAESRAITGGKDDN